ncbi:hypothetical protein SDC9_185515 [bioreactor metagenome]|uniref:Uncharacterized protein n=1 Tax=bioreactor metagenome TaxID=1076179 RepID=A0A645HRJ5_9ZZZZ
MLRINRSFKPGELQCVGGLLNRQVIRSDRRLEKRGFGIHQFGEVVEFFRCKAVKGYFDGQAVAEIRLVCAAFGSSRQIIVFFGDCLEAVQTAKVSDQLPVVLAHDRASLVDVVAATLVGECRCSEVIGRGVKFMADGCDQ